MPSRVVRPCCGRIDDMSSVREWLGRRRVARGLGDFRAFASAAIPLCSIGLLNQVGDVGIVAICLAPLTAGTGPSDMDSNGEGMHGKTGIQDWDWDWNWNWGWGQTMLDTPA